MILIYVGLGLLLGLILLANVIDAYGSEKYKQLFHTLLFIGNIPIALVGLMLILIPTDTFVEATGGVPQVTMLKAIGPAVLFMGLWGAASTHFYARAVLARWMPLEPASSVHTVALILSGYLVGNSLINLSFGGLEGLAETIVPASITDIVISQLTFAFIGIVGVGWLVRRHGRELLERLGLEWPRPNQWLAGLGWIVLLLVLQTIAGYLWTLFDPEQAEILESINITLLQEMDTVGKWFILATAAGVGEEILFRGALQPVLGLGFTSLLFAFAHIQYGFTPITVFVVLMGIIFGVIRQRHNTTIAVFVHFGYDFVLGLLFLSLPYLEQWAS